MFSLVRPRNKFRRSSGTSNRSTYHAARRGALDRRPGMRAGSMAARRVGCPLVPAQCRQDDSRGRSQFQESQRPEPARSDGADLKQKSQGATSRCNTSFRATSLAQHGLCPRWRTRNVLENTANTLAPLRHVDRDGYRVHPASEIHDHRAGASRGGSTRRPSTQTDSASAELNASFTLPGLVTSSWLRTRATGVAPATWPGPGHSERGSSPATVV